LNLSDHVFGRLSPPLEEGWLAEGQTGWSGALKRFGMPDDPGLRPPLQFLLSLLLLCSCQQEMANRARFSPMDYSPFFKDGRVARPQPLGTVAQLSENAAAADFPEADRKKLEEAK